MERGEGCGPRGGEGSKMRRWRVRPRAAVWIAWYWMVRRGVSAAAPGPAAQLGYGSWQEHGDMRMFKLRATHLTELRR